MINLIELNKFLYKAAKAGYATGNDKLWKKEADWSSTITFEEDSFKMHDNYFGGEPYGGREVIFYQGNPVWMMVYYGSVKEEVKDIEEIYQVLRKALNQVPGDLPLRGPEKLKIGEYKYTFISKGNIQNFTGEEKIFKNGQEIYKANFVGGLVDKR